MKRFGISIVLILILAAATALRADITVKSKITSTGFMGIGAMEGETITYTTAMMQKTWSSMKFTQGLVKFFAGSEPKESVRISRLDKELFWDLNIPDKEYTETTFQKFRDDFNNQEAKTETKNESDDKEYKYSATVDVDQHGEKKTINGFDCEHVVITLTVIRENIKTGEKSEQTKIINDGWYARSLTAAENEIEAFNKAQVAKLKIDLEQASSAVLAASYGKYLTEMSNKASTIKGLPILMTFTIKNAVPPQKKEEVKQEEEKKDEEETPTSLGGLFGGLVKKATKSAEPKKDTTATADSEQGVMFKTTSEVTAVQSAAIPASEFEIPAGYTKK